MVDDLISLLKGMKANLTSRLHPLEEKMRGKLLLLTHNRIIGKGSKRPRSPLDNIK
jgi:hypothetical protein